MCVCLCPRLQILVNPSTRGYTKERSPHVMTSTPSQPQQRASPCWLAFQRVRCSSSTQLRRRQANSSMKRWVPFSKKDTEDRKFQLSFVSKVIELADQCHCKFCFFILFPPETYRQVTSDVCTMGSRLGEPVFGGALQWQHVFVQCGKHLWHHSTSLPAPQAG